MEFRKPNGGNYSPHTEHLPVAHAATSAPPPPQKRRGLSRAKTGLKGNWWKLLLVLIVSAVIAWLAYGYIHTKNQLKAAKSSPQTSTQTETQRLVSQIGKLTVLPTGETPTVATVTDVSKLKDQPFFVNARTGDKVLIYTNAKKAFLYRPSTNKIVNIAPVNLGDQTGTTTPTTTKKP